LPESVLLVLDPNCRPSTVSDPDSYRERVRRLVARADVVKVSGDDVAYLQPHVAPLEAARNLLTDGARLVLFTDGASSVFAISADWEFEVPVPRVDVVDTVGAGDAFGGAFIAWWHEANLGRDDLADSTTVRAAVERAIRVAGITCGRAGANPPLASELS
jgi:fructokinase